MRIRPDRSHRSLIELRAHFSRDASQIRASVSQLTASSGYAIRYNYTDPGAKLFYAWSIALDNAS
jgi:hypothetical protein